MHVNMYVCTYIHTNITMFISVCCVFVCSRTFILIFVIHVTLPTPHLLYKGSIQVVRPSDAEVEDIHFGGNGVVERVKEPGGVRHLEGEKIRGAGEKEGRIERVRREIKEEEEETREGEEEAGYSLCGPIFVFQEGNASP